jgi:hypothetical protein
VAGTAYEQLVEDFCCPGASSSKKRGACSESNELKGLCCWQKPCFFTALQSELSGDGNSIVFLSDLDHTGAKDTVAKDLEIFHYYIPTSTFTRITKTNNEDYDEDQPSVSYKGDRIAWRSDFDFVDNASLVDRNQIFLAELSMGCSGSTDATNYVETPDVETCCTWSDEIQPHAAGAATVGVSLTFGLNQSAMIEGIPFKTAAEVDRAAFCSRVAESVKSDVACALDIPPSLITVDTGSAACDWASDFSQAVTVKLTLHKICRGTAAGLLEPVDLAASIVSQHSDSSSRLWRGYLTKTLDKDVVPATENIQASTSEATCVLTTAGPATDAPTSAAPTADTKTTDAPTTDAPATKAASADATTTATTTEDQGEKALDVSSASLLALAAIGLQC